jgi:excisionase family DNA binding protein
MFITTGQAARRLGVHIQTIKGMVNRKQLRGEKIGGWNRIVEADVVELERKAGGK